MVGIEDLIELTKLTLYTAYLEGERPVSLMLISDRPEAGKSELLKLFAHVPGVVYLTDITAFSLWRDFREEIKAGSINYLLFPEFQTPMAKTKATKDSFIQAINDLVETGATEVHSGFLPKPVRLTSPRVIGVICCFPRSTYNKERRTWLMSGFLSRFLVATYSYSDETVEQIKRSIVAEEYRHNAPLEIRFPSSRITVKIPDEIDKLARFLEEDITEGLVAEGRAYGFRTLKIVRRLMKASALEQQRTRVQGEDYRRIERLSYLFVKEYEKVRR